MKTYMQQLISAAQDNDISILKAFEKAKVPTSTYYRTIHGGDLRYSTARKVWDAINSNREHLSAK